MSSYELNKAVHHIYIDRARALAFKAGEHDCLDDFELSDAEKQALAKHDFPALWAMDVHPVLLFHLSAVLYPREHYIRNVAPAIAGVPNAWYDYYKSS